MVLEKDRIRGANQASIQEANRTLVMRLLKRRGLCSRVELARMTGLKQATITNIISDLIRMGLVYETGLIGGGKGRRAIGLTIRQDAFYVIGLRLTRRFFRVGLFNTAGEQIDHKRYNISDRNKPRTVMRDMLAGIHDMISAHPSCNVLAACISIPGPYYPRIGRILAVTEFHGWDDVDIRKEFEEGLDIPVVLEHDANVGAVAEWWNYPHDSENEVMVYLAIGQGVGAGIISHGELFKGAYGTAGEVGHFSMNALGEKCECNNRGCLTMYASTIGFARRVEEEIQKGEKTVLKEGFTFSELAAAVREHDPLAFRLFKEDVVRYLGTLLVNLIWTYSPSEIVIGDEMAEVGDVLVEELRQFVKDHTLPYLTEWTKIRLSGLADDPAYVGSADLAMDLIWDRPRLWENLGRNS